MCSCISAFNLTFSIVIISDNERNIFKYDKSIRQTAMGKRPAASKSTRGVSKAKVHVQSSSSNPKTRKFRSQYSNLAVIEKKDQPKKVKNAIRNKPSKKVIVPQKSIDEHKEVYMSDSESDSDDNPPSPIEPIKQKKRGKKK